MTPSGHKLDPDLMPWDMFGRMTDDEFKAIWLYLRSLSERVKTWQAVDCHLCLCHEIRNQIRKFTNAPVKQLE